MNSIMTYGIIALLIIFQPELRRALEQLGSNTMFKFLGIDKSIANQTKENIYKTIIAVEEMSKSKTGALIVFERDIKLKDIVETGIEIDAAISPQLLVNIFVPNTPLHDGAVIINNNKITSAACILPLADDKNISKKLGTRHRAAVGISKEADAIAIVVSEETGKVSIAKDGILIVDVNEDTLKRLLIKYLVKDKYNKDNKNKKSLKDIFKKTEEKAAVAVKQDEKDSK